MNAGAIQKDHTTKKTSGTGMIPDVVNATD
jgi:hypothetical protein